ncbi:hypothetical protein JTB14_020688 [Gonioctena quinquepunctata]|nr:hypothetical protein JTB14_020688 [Gonioctena quinquepunctata]
MELIPIKTPRRMESEIQQSSSWDHRQHRSRTSAKAASRQIEELSGKLRKTAFAIRVRSDGVRERLRQPSGELCDWPESTTDVERGARHESFEKYETSVDINVRDGGVCVQTFFYLHMILFL